MNRASSATGWVRNPTIKSPDLDPHLASSYELGWTFNPITGCLNGCPYCYARKLANGRLRSRYLANKNVRNPRMSDDIGLVSETDPFYPRFWPERLWQPARESEGRKKSLGIFTVDMGEFFGDWVPQEWQNKIFKVIRTCDYHRFYLLTKQPQNLANFSPFPPNCWLGVTATGATMAYQAHWYLQNQVDAKVKFLSLEPLLETISFDALDGIDWLIIGAQTKPYRPPRKEWVEEIVSVANHAGTPIFLKDNLYPLLGLGNGKSILHNNCNGTLRQEMP